MASREGLRRQVLAALKEQGWSVGHTRRGHLRCLAPDGVTIVVTGGSSGDHYAIWNFISMLKRKGFVWRGARPKGVATGG